MLAARAGPPDGGTAARPARPRPRTIDPWLEEIRDPKWHGTPAEKAAEAYAELRGRPPHDRWRGLDGGESVREFVDRIRLGAAKFLAERGVHAHARASCRCGRSTNRARASCSSPTPARTRWSSATCSACSRRRGSGTASCSATPRSAGSRRSRLGDGYTFSLTALSDVEHLAPTTAPAEAPIRRDLPFGHGRPRCALKRSSSSCSSKLEGAVTVGDDPPRRPARAVPGARRRRRPLTTAELADGHRPRRALGAGVGVQPGGAPSSSGRSDDGADERFSLTPEAAAVLAVARPRGVRHGDVPPPAADDGDARATAGELPHRPRPRLRQPRPGGCGRHRAQLRAVEPAPPAARTCCPRSTASSTRLDGRHRRRRRRLRRRRSGAAAGGSVPGQHVHRLRHLPVRARPRRRAPRRGGRRRTSRFVDPRDEPLPDRPLASTSSRRSTASTT